MIFFLQETVGKDAQFHGRQERAEHRASGKRVGWRSLSAGLEEMGGAGGKGQEGIQVG